MRVTYPPKGTHPPINPLPMTRYRLATAGGGLPLPPTPPPQPTRIRFDYFSFIPAARALLLA